MSERSKVSTEELEASLVQGLDHLRTPQVPADVDLVGRVLRAAAAEPPPRMPLLTRLRAAFWVMPLLVSAGAVALWLRPSVDSGGETGMVARAGDEDASRWVGLQVFSMEALGPRRVVSGDPVATQGMLAFAYVNHGPTPAKYLAVFAVDGRGGVHWYYPDGSQQPAQSIPVHLSRTAVELPDQVGHPLPAGPLQLRAVFTQEPWSTQDLEKRLSDRGAAALGIAGSVEHVLQLTARGLP